MWGACSASWYYFRVPPRELTLHQAAALVAILPMPKNFRPALGDNRGIVPVELPEGSKFQPRRLIEYAVDNVPPTVTTHGLLERAEGLVAGEPSGACDDMPPGVAAALYRLEHADT